MATTTTITKLLFRRGNDADRIQTILASGEPGFALDTGRVWIGDGATPGGIPVIAAADHHLNYVDDTGAVNGNFSRQKLDLNTAGLSATLAGDRTVPSYASAPKLFHPADRDIISNYPLQLTGLNDGSGNSIEFTSDNPNNSFYIGRSNPGLINIGDVILLDTVSKTLSLQAGGTLNFAASAVKFADSDVTVFEDKSVDLNVPIVSGNIIGPGVGAAINATAEETGHYYGHMGVLSAGKVAVKADKSFEGWNTVQVRPPVYDPDWADRSTGVRDRLQGTITTDTAPPMPRLALWNNRNLTAPSEASDWVGADRHDDDQGNAIPWNSTNQYSCKNINIRSVRPADGQTSVYVNAAGVTIAGYGDVSGRSSGNDAWDGDVDLVFETGLMVYGPGDRDLQPGFNAYAINQSLDSMAYPTFQGLRIEGPNASPIGVESGGTGNDSFTKGRALRSSTVSPTGPLEEIEAAYNNTNIIGVNSSGHHVGATVSLTPADWFAAPPQSNGNISITSKFVPNGTTAPGGHHQMPVQVKQMFFDKYSAIVTDGQTTRPQRFDSQLKLSGDQTNVTTEVNPAGNMGGSAAADSSGIYQWSETSGPLDTVTFNHVEHAVEGNAFDLGAKSGDVSTIVCGVGNAQGSANGGINGNGVVVGDITINKGGHIRDIAPKDLDQRFAQIFHIGTQAQRSGGTILSPGNAGSGSPGLFNFDITQGIGGVSPSSDTRTQGWLGAGNSVTFDAQIIDAIQFNDYGTVKSITIRDLGDYIYGRHQIASILDKVSDTVDAIYVELGNRLHRTQNSNTTGTITTSWLQGSKVQFGYTTSATTSLYEDSDEFFIASSKQIDLTGPSVDIRANGNTGTTADDGRLLVEANQQRFYASNEHVCTLNSSGITMQSGNMISGQGNHHVVASLAEASRSVRVYETDSNLSCSLMFKNDRVEDSDTYETVYADAELYYNPGTNTLHSPFYTGDGRHLDMSNNDTIPPSVELETASTGSFNVVLCQSNRNKIYDKTNLMTVDAGTGSLNVAGDIIAFSSFSDRRLKKNITTLNSYESLQKVLALSGVTYEWKGAPERGEKIGLIAQEVEEVVPQVISESPRGDDMSKTYKRVDYEALVPLLVESIKELTSKVEYLEAKLDNK